MALVADIQLQNNSVTPEKIDTNQYFTFGSVSATTGVFIGPALPGSLSGLLTLKTANDTEAWFQTTKTDGDVNLYINNDSNIYWRMSLSGEAPVGGGVADSFYIQKGADPNTPDISTLFTIQPEGNVGIGTEIPNVNSILDLSSTDSTSANITLRNQTNSTIVKISAGVSDVSFGSESDTAVSLKVNDNVIGSVKVTGFDLQTSKSYLINNQVSLSETNLYVSSYAGVGTSSPNVMSFAAGHTVITSKGTTTGKSGNLELVSNDSVIVDGTVLGTINFVNNTTRVGYIHSETEGTGGNSGHLVFSTTNAGVESEVLRISNAGSVGINQNNPDPSYALDITGSVNVTGSIFQGGTQTANWLDNAGEIYRLSNVGVGITNPAYDFHVQDSGVGNLAQIGVDTYNATNATNASELLLRRSNDDTGGTLTATIDTQLVGLISFHGVNSSNAFTSLADISVVQSGAAGASYAAGNIVFKTATSTVAPTERVRINSTGLGVGTAPSYPIDVVGDINTSTEFKVGGNSLIANNTNDYVITGAGSGTLNGEINLTFNGSVLTVGGNVVPAADSTHDLGTSIARWQTLYIDTLGDNGQALGVAATTLSFDTAATIDTSGSNQLDINTGTANTVITAGTVTVSNNFTVDTTTLHVDATNNRVGIGLTNPAYTLDVVGNANISTDFVVDTTTLYVDSTNNNVGIGTATPNASYSLEVIGDINFSGNLYQAGSLFSGGGGGYWTQTVNDIYYNTGNVGIGNTGPNASYALDVTGDINFSGNLYQAGSLFSGGGGGSNNNTLLWPNYVSTSNDAHKVVFADLNDGNYVWGWEEAKTLIRGTSWYALQGQPPVYGAFIIDASQNAIHWIDRRNSTLGPYMSFTVGTTNMAYGATISDIIFKDFKLYIVDNNVTGYGVTVIDFINDTSYLYTTSGVSKYNSNIGNRNNGNGYMLLSSSPAIRDNNVNVIDVIEDQGGNLDDDGRPLHYWAAGTDAGLSLYIPSNTGGIGNIYDSSDANNVYSVSFVGGSLMWSINDTNDKTLIREVYSTVAADAFTTDYSMDSTQNDWSQTFFNGSETLTDTVAYINSEGEEISLVGSDQGLSIHNLYGGEIAMTNTFVTPYMKGTRIAAYPLLDINDKSGNGYNFTGQANPPTFGTAGIYGNSANFDGTQYLLQTVSDFGPVSDFTISLMMKTNDNTLPVADEFLTRLSDGSVHSLSLWATTSGGIDFNVFNSPTVDSWVSNSVYDSQWHHIVFTRSGSTYYAYIDGVLVNTWVSTVSSATSLTLISIGSNQIGTQHFGGQIEQVFYGKTAYTSKEVADEYDRMQAALAGKNGLLTATDIDTIKVDPDSGYAIVTAGDTAHIMNANLGIIYDTDVVSAGTLNDADIKTMFGATEPHYFLAGSTSLEQVAPPTTGEGPANEAGGGASISSVFFLMGA